jgi:hypothetical protein
MTKIKFCKIFSFLKANSSNSMFKKSVRVIKTVLPVIAGANFTCNGSEIELKTSQKI